MMLRLMIINQELQESIKIIVITGQYSQGHPLIESRNLGNLAKYLKSRNSISIIDGLKENEK